MLAFSLIFTAAFAAAFVYCSFFEWTLHKYIMHMDHLLKYPHRAHQLEHHEIFKADGTYFIQDPKDLNNVTFAWWNAPLLIALHSPLFAGAYFFLGGLPALLGMFTAMAGYYALYEYLHFCMHVPGNRSFERTRFFKFVQEHHRLHHVYYMKNLNVVIPIADFILGTRVPLKDAKLFEKLEQVRLRKLNRASETDAAKEGEAA